MRKHRGSESLPWRGRWSRAKDGIQQQRAWRQELLSGALTDSADSVIERRNLKSSCKRESEHIREAGEHIKNQPEAELWIKAEGKPRKCCPSF